MKKWLILLLTLLMVLSLVACNEVEEKEPSENDETNLFSVTYNGTAMALGKPAEAVLNALGEPISSQEVFDCGEGNSRMYYRYASFDLYVMKADGKELIDQIELRDDLAELSCGISIGASADSVRQKAGDPTKEEDGKLTYSSGNQYLIIELENGTVSEIGLLRKTK